jgi:hypothetical protein
MSKKTEIIRLQDDAPRYITQAQAICSSLICDDQFKYIGEDASSCLIWTIDDHLSDLKATQQKIYELGKEATP